MLPFGMNSEPSKMTMVLATCAAVAVLALAGLLREQVARKLDGTWISRAYSVVVGR